MKEIKQNSYKGTRILLGNEKRELIDKMVSHLRRDDFQEIQIPVIQHREFFQNKVGIENTSMMFSVKDNSPDRDLVLAPEYTAIIQKLAQTTFKFQKDVKLFYVQECFRGEPTIWTLQTIYTVRSRDTKSIERLFRGIDFA